MIAGIVYEFPLGWLCAVPLLAGIAFVARRQHRRGLATARIATLASVRLLALAPLVFLGARPQWLSKEPPAAASRPVMLLMDRSESMSLQENDLSRYDQALNFLRERLLPALKSSRLPVQAILFD